MTAAKSRSTTQPSQPRWILPTERMNPTRQLIVVDTIAELGGAARQPVTVRAVSERMRVSEDSIGGSQGFLIQSGLLEAGRGAWAVTETGLQLARLRAATDSARPRLLLRDHWRTAWFTTRAGKALQHGPLEANELAKRLHRGLRGCSERSVYLVEWLTYALIVHQDEHDLCELADEEKPSTGASHIRPSAPVTDPLIATDIGAVCDLPHQDFLSLLGAYRSIFSLAPGKSPSTG